MKKIELAADFLQTIDWFKGNVIDWGSAGNVYAMDGTTKQLYTESFTGVFNGSTSSADGKYAFIYQKNGTKGLLLKNGVLLREINRTHYCAEVHEYPAAFVSIDDKTYLIHCPVAYKQLDFEDVETGELVTNIPNRNPADIFHSRLEISPENTYLLSKGWFWQPLDHVQAYHIKDCLANPKLLDEYNYLGLGMEICTASFIDDKTILIGSSDEEIGEDDDNRFPARSIATLNLETNQVSTPVNISYEFGNLYAINKDLAWDMYKFPKMINIHTGKMIAKDEDVNSGKQCSAMFNHTKSSIQISISRETRGIAISGYEKVYILLP